jgi:MATE family multidrug resistance protein
MLPLLWFQTLRNVTVGLRRPGPMLGITLVSAVLNAGLDYALMFGVFGLPALGLTGIAWATTLVNLFAFAAFLLIVRCDPMLGRFLSMGMRRHDVRQAMRRILRMGWPVAGTYASEAGFFMVVALLAGAIGADALAAHTVVNQAVYMVFMISVGLSHAASISISKVWAQGDVRAARRYGAAGLGIGLACMAVVALAYLTAPHQVLRLFLHRDSAAVWSIAAQLMTIAAVLQFFDCGQNIGVGILRGTGETGSAFALTLIGYWGVGLPAAWLLGDVFGCGAPGIWIGLVLGLMAAAVMLLRRFHRLTARRLVVKRTQELLPAKRG